MSRRFCVFVLVLCCCVLFAETSRADSFAYTFESPNFTLGQTTPLLNIAPNVGAATFRTSFTDTVDPTAYQISNMPVNRLISGPALFAPFATTSALTLTFNTPITQLSLDFAIPIPPNRGGFLRLVTSSGSLDQVSSTDGSDLFPGGTLTFSAATPFSSATLQGFLVFA